MEDKLYDKGLKAIDDELADIDKRLKRVLSETDSVLKEWKQDAGEDDGPGDGDEEE